MPRIEWKGIIDNPTDYQRGYLSENAKKLNMPKTLNEMMIKALPFVNPSILIIFISMFLKTTYARQVVIDPVAVILGFICGVLALPVHELLHAIVYSKTVCGSRIDFLSAPARQIYFDVLTAISARNYTNHVILHISAYSYWNERFPVWIIYNGINKPVCG